MVKARLALSNSCFVILNPNGFLNVASDSGPSIESVDYMSSVMSYHAGTLTTMVPVRWREVVGMKLT
jgi:hypothetical protein